ncbi:MAG TPA: transcription antitermination factor NusB [Candidatus Nanopelagicales bacterium]|nr:transcription antitermination factor NusB [Candidatus Nanopelagicales bacterium]
MSRPPGRGRPAQWRSDRRATDPSRLAAFDVLRAVDEDGSYANLIAPVVFADAGLTGRDAGFATELAYGALRQRRWLDAVLAGCVDRPLAEVDPPVLDVLRLGAYQLLVLGTAPHAAVGETVQLARLVGGESRSRFVNAVLRRVGERTADEWVSRVAPDPEADPLGHLAVVRSHPDWIAAALHEALRDDGMPGWGDLEDLLIADNEPPGVTLTARPGRCEVEELLAEPGSRRGRWSPFAVRLGHGSPAAVPAVRQHRAGVQDEGSQLVALALTRAELTGPDRSWLDLCAGPGGKAALLAAIGAQRGASLIAADRAPHRAELVSQAVAGHGEVEVVVADSRAGPWPAGSQDRVLLDAPCSGLGVVRRRAESRWRKQREDVAELAVLQRELLTAALAAVRVGGIVGYATCSPNLAETTEVVADALATGSVTQLDVRPLLPEVDRLGEGPALRLWPHRHGTDGMFLALLRRTA